MPKLPVFPPRKIVKLLESRGFVLDRVKGSHHIYIHPGNGRRVVVPLHKRDLPRGTVYSILKQAGIERDDLDS